MDIEKIKDQRNTQFDVLELPKRYKGAKGGRASGKSHYFARLIVLLSATYHNLNIVCIREIQKSLKHSAKKLIEDQIEKYGLTSMFYITQTEIHSRLGGTIIFQGLQDHTSDSIKSLENFHIAWVEEAQRISHRSLELLLPTIRSQGSEIWFSWNPTYEDDPVELLFNTLNEENSIIVKSNFDTNRYLADTIKEEAERHKLSNPDTYNHVWLGEYKTSDAGSVYKIKDENLTQRTLGDREDIIIGQDFNIGGCCSVVYVRSGDTMYAVDEFSSHDTFTIRDTLLKRYSNHSIEIIPDASGKAGKTNATKSDIAILRGAGFKVNAPKKNPRIEDRINATNNLYREGRLFINKHKCPNFYKAQVKQQYDDNGNPEKFSGAGTIDDWNDAGTYPIHRLFGGNKATISNVEISFT